MKSYLIAGNWKSNKTTNEAMEWLQKLSAISLGTRDSGQELSAKNNTFVLCAPYTLLFFMKQEIDRLQLPIALGTQDVSPFGDGAYTGAVSARQVKEFADWVIIGHSERRKYFGETDAILVQKVAKAKEAGLRVVYCVPDETTVVPWSVDVVAYEPVWAIGTGKAETPEHANAVIAAIKAKTQIAMVIYGGSVTPDNVASFLAQSAIDGVLPGGASLDAEKFAALLQAVEL